MSMAGEIATEHTIKAIVERIKAELQNTAFNEDYKYGLKAAGLIALDNFDWDTPEWAKEYKELFEK